MFGFLRNYKNMFLLDLKYVLKHILIFIELSKNYKLSSSNPGERDGKLAYPGFENTVFLINLLV